MSNDPASLDELNRRFAIPGSVRVASGTGGLTKVCVTTPLSSAEIYLHGAQVTSWKPAGGDEVLFVSAKSHWKDGRAIRGGIPICFPWFRGKAENPQAPAHGVVRTKAWTLDAITHASGGSVVVSLKTTSDESTRRWWPHDFSLTHRVTIGVALQLELIVENDGASSFHFEEALHTYFRVGDVERAQVRGLDGLSYLDNTDANREKMQSGDLMLRAATDSAYLNAHGAAEIADPSLGRSLRTSKENSATTVVWNPWQQGAAALADLGDDEWKQMLCVEASNILSSAVALAPGETHTMRATIDLA